MQYIAAYNIDFYIPIYRGNVYILIMELTKPVDVSSIRVSHKLRSRLAKIRARLTLKDGKDRSMEELIDMLADAYEEREGNEK
jgi:hypothetical protein